MEKYAVDEEFNTDDMEKDAADEVKCPRCGATCEVHGKTRICPECGTAPFEGGKR
jgi:ribosomal protein S27AE